MRTCVLSLKACSGLDLLRSWSNVVFLPPGTLKLFILLMQYSGNYLNVFCSNSRSSSPALTQTYWLSAPKVFRDFDQAGRGIGWLVESHKAGCRVEVLSSTGSCRPQNLDLPIRLWKYQREPLRPSLTSQWMPSALGKTCYHRTSHPLQIGREQS